MVTRYRAALAGVSLMALVGIAPATAATDSDSAFFARPKVEVAFVVDTTGSMAGLIEGAKRKIWSIATAIVDANPEAEVRMALVAYRDIGDDYVTQHFDLTTDIQDLYAKLLGFQARGGGDWPESVNEALSAAVGKLAWSQEPTTKRIVFLVGDAPPHMDYKQDTKYPETLALARQRGIVVNAVQAGGARDTERVWRDIAQQGEGAYLPIPQDGGVVLVIPSPYDDELLELQRELEGTVIPFGPARVQSETSKRVEQLRAAPAPTARDVSSYYAKKAGPREVISGRGDLVAEIEAKRTTLGDVKEQELPPELKALPAPQRQVYVEERLAKRRALSERIGELVKKRDAFVADARKAQPRTRDSFDRVVEETLKAQVRRR